MQGFPMSDLHWFEIRWKLSPFVHLTVIRILQLFRRQIPTTPRIVQMPVHVCEGNIEIILIYLSIWTEHFY